MTRSRPEILAPAGEPACLEAAVAGGADAVYLGLRHFNARGRAANFHSRDLARHVGYLHHHGLRCYVVLNTLVHDDECAKALGLADHARCAGVDALIVQDLGLWRLLREELPQLPLHASTQMTVHSPEQVAVLAGLGAERVILARELDREGVAACTRAARELGIETEHFVHGALCYAYSGQCLISNFAGCRSANRGTCAQNCRYVYRDEQGHEDTVLSMRDSALITAVDELAELGVASLKIEGRLKGPDYVYTVSRVYRELAEAWAAGRTCDQTALAERLAGVFSRGHSDAWWRGEHGEAARALRGGEQRAAEAWIIEASRSQGRVLLRSATRPEPGQGFSWQDGAWSDGFLVTAVDPGPQAQQWRCRVRLAAKGPPLRPETPCFRNIDHARQREAAEACARVRIDALPELGLSCRLEVVLRLGAPPWARLRCADGREVEVLGEQVVQPAAGRPLDEAAIRRSLGAFGGSGFHLEALQIETDDGAFVPLAALKTLRRHLLDAMAEAPVVRLSWQPPALLDPPRLETAIWAVVGDAAAAEAALAAGAQRVVLDDPRLDWSAPPSLAALPAEVWLRQLPHAPWHPALGRLGRGLLVGQLGQLAQARQAGLPVAGDHPLNCVNLACLRQLGELGLSAACISLECSSGEAAKLCARRAGVPGLPEVLLCVHGRLPAMFTVSEHGLAAGEERRFSAHPREGGLPYRLQGRCGCGPVLYEARELCAPRSALGSAALVGGWLLELAHLPAATVGSLVGLYRRLAAGEEQLAEEIEALTTGYAEDGCFPGHLAIGSRALDLVRERLAD